MPIISLQSSDGELFPVDIEVAKKSMLIKTMLEDLEEAGEDNDEEVPIPNVNAAILKLVIQWATYHKDDSQPNDDENTNTRCFCWQLGLEQALSQISFAAENINISDWDASFLSVDQGTLYELILAANYLDIKGLLNVTCGTVANMIKGKTVEEIRKQFNNKKLKLALKIMHSCLWPPRGCPLCHYSMH